MFYLWMVFALYEGKTIHAAAGSCEGAELQDVPGLLNPSAAWRIDIQASRMVL
jgi:hypothetical protein